ncbi:ABC transporter ATP-binding protein [Sphingomonas sp. BIUV-7]|uniref:ABC transporter ATP-binding protein n=1 Tax=Sphingomonas natans TaxID=3063330 RepID=A0ABT8Y730_9SPHN|nr:ABC transporter ATP-binding protein [Sphingomonas sp. BIUV-7]MDO6414129.1 ABC transporter ATP-binding protein [Sphingomonas sp. BIUV-7]
MVVPKLLLEITDLRKTVPGGRLLFDGLAMRLEAGELIAIMGESGVGKSTLLNLIAGLDVPDAGVVELDGVALAALDEDGLAALRRRRIGFVFQAFHILPHLTLAQNVGLPLALLRAAPAEVRARAIALLAAVGLAGRENDYPGQLSGGELQRVAIARALAHRPALILADEPTGNLDPETAARILALLIGQLREAGAGGLLVTHSDVAAACADRVLRLTATGLVEA